MKRIRFNNFDHMGPHSKWYLFMVLFIAIAINYLPDIAPYYFKLFTNSELTLIGRLSNYAENCQLSSDSSPASRTDCRIIYRIPYDLYKGREAIGLGILINNPVVTCSSTGGSVLPTHLSQSTPYILLKTYQVIDLRSFDCRSDLIIKIVSRKSDFRFGYSQSITSIGDFGDIKRISWLVEFVIDAAIFILFVLLFSTKIVRQLFSVVGQVKIGTDSYDKTWKNWFLFLIGIYSDQVVMLFPFFSGLIDYGPKLVQFAGLAIFSNYILDQLTEKISYILKFSLISPRIGRSPILFKRAFNVALAFVVIFHGSGKFYVYGLLICACFGLMVSLRKKDNLFVVFYLAGLIDIAKIFMNPYFPASRVVFIFALITLCLKEVIRVATLIRYSTYRIELDQITAFLHDIRSPIFTLRTIFSSRTDTDALGSDALRRIGELIASLQSVYELSPDRREIGRTINLTDFLRNREAFYRRQFDGSDTRLVCELGEEPALVFIDPTTLERVLSNLIENAVKNRKPDRILEIRFKISSQNKRVTLSISDTGLGIPHVKLSQLFLRRNNSKDGFGVGLVYSRKMLEIYGCTMKVESEVDVGTAVSLVFPSAANNLPG